MADEADPEQVMDLAVRRHGAARVVEVRGEVDMLTAPALRGRLREELGGAPQLVVVDLTGVTFLGSSGLAVLVAAAQQANDLGVRFRLVCTTRAVIRPLTATGLADVLDTCTTLEQALAGGTTTTPSG
ncbi:anti-sigma factor antagonist [Longimycelium tulufanense]|uniref:Anti-sigma factor antagonist n=1 Tax=Longimycelium tulufanense TaxID=907463 RepID=A0A8J3FSC8_9PSEU|nr:anti-sigma factor antagonist [Longimycelium tulufanense]